MRMLSGKVLIGILVAGACASAAWAQTAVTAASQGAYSKAQATDGAALYAERCASCHGESMGGQDVTPPLAGTAFMRNWADKPIADLATRIRTTMPLDEPGAFGLADSAKLVAVILQANGYKAGAADLPSSTSAQQAIKIDALDPAHH